MSEVKIVVLPEEDPKSDREKIFFVTVMKEKYEEDELAIEEEKKLFSPQRLRCWGWCKTFEMAEKQVIENVTDLFEANWHNLAVIEEMAEGVAQLAKVVQWYRADYTNMRTLHDPTVNKCDPPVGIKSFNFCFG